MSAIVVIFLGALGALLSLVTGMSVPHAIIEPWIALGLIVCALGCCWLLWRKIPAGYYFRLPLFASWGVAFLCGTISEIGISLLPGTFPEKAFYVSDLVVVLAWWCLSLHRIRQRRRDDGTYW